MMMKKDFAGMAIITNIAHLTGLPLGKFRLWWQHPLIVAGIFILPFALNACATVKVEPPSEPIEINLNVKVEGEILVKLDREIQDVIDENPDIF